MQVQTSVTLTEREQNFVLALAHGFRPTRAATLAGYAVSSAKLLLAKPHIREAIKAVARNSAAIVEKIERREARRGQE